VYITSLVDFTPAHKSFNQVWFQRGYRATGF